MKVPELVLPLVGGGEFRLSAHRPKSFALLVFYRGLHCPVCRIHLRDLDEKLEAFSNAGVEAVAISCDSKPRAEQAKAEWEINRLPIAYGLSIDQARRWGLFVSQAIKDSEPREFAEPGLFLVRPDGTLYAAAIQTMPFARPSFADILGAVQFVTKHGYPARGEARASQIRNYGTSSL